MRMRMRSFVAHRWCGGFIIYLIFARPCAPAAFEVQVRVDDGNLAPNTI